MSDARPGIGRCRHLLSPRSPLPIAGSPSDNYGIASTGDHVVNTLIQVQVIDNAADFKAVTELEARQPPVLGTFPENKPVGRSAIVEQVAGDLASGMSVQLFGAPGVGKKAIARGG